MLPIDKIICPTDFSEPSNAAIMAAGELAGHFSAELILANVVTPIHPVSAPGIPSGYKLESYYAELAKHAAQSLEDIERDQIPEGVKVRRIVRQGSAADEILELVQDEAADLMVVATAGQSGWRRFLFGSVADKLVRMAECPVTTIREPIEDA